MAIKNEIGNRYGKLTVIEVAEPLPDKTAVWKCLCDCGEVRFNPGNKLRAGFLKSCGCGSPRFTKESLTTHGLSRTRTYQIWSGMLQRCDPKTASPKCQRNYVDRGITVCDRWKTFENFYEDMGECPENLSIDRKNNDLGYFFENCRWATNKQQCNNVRRNHKIEFNGDNLTVSEWADKLQIKQNTLLYRIRRGWSLEKALKMS